MELYEHQQKIISDDPKRALIALGTGGGKTRVCLELARKRTLVICPKQQKVDETWEKNAKKFQIEIDLTVVSKETFRRDWRNLGPFDTVIVDECHNMLGFYPDMKYVRKVQVPKTSQMFEALREYVEIFSPERFYIASATPVSKPMNLYAIAILIGKKWDFFKFRTYFYFEKKIGFRSLWMPRKDEATKQRLADLTKSFGYTGQLSGWFDVPEQTHKTIYVPLTTDQRAAIKELAESEADPMAIRAKTRTIENGVLYAMDVSQVSEKESRIGRHTEFYDNDKLDQIGSLADEFPKLLVFAAFTGQVYAIARDLERLGHTVYTLTGETKDRGTVISAAEEASEAVVIAQAAISSGYELPSFPCVVFASKSYRYVDYEQGLGRVLRANAIKKNLYVHLVVKGGVDEACHQAIMSGQDFQEKLMEND